MIQTDILKTAIESNHFLSAGEKYCAKVRLSMQFTNDIDRTEALNCDYADLIRDIVIEAIQAVTECRKKSIHQYAEILRQQDI